MKSRMVSLILVLSLVLFALSGCGNSGTATSAAKNDDAAASKTADNTVYNLKLATRFDDPTAIDSIDANPKYLQRVVEGIKEVTNGRVVITPYYSSTLGNPVELTEQVISGDIDILFGQIPASVDPRQGIWTVPYMFKDLEQVQELMADPDAPLFKLAQDWAADLGLYLACTPVSSFRGIANNTKKITDASSVKELKIRTYEDAIGKIFWSSLCNCMIISMGELFTSMQTGAVDGYEMNAVSVATVSVFYEMTEKYSNIDWQWDNTQNVYFNMETWKSLPEDLRKQVSNYLWECCDIYAQEKMALLADDTLSKLFADVGIEYHALTDAERQTWIDAARACDAAFEKQIGSDIWNNVWNILNK